MAYFVLKAAISGALIALISEVARRSPGIGGLIASLPLVSIVAVIWLWRDTSDIERIAAHPVAVAGRIDEIVGHAPARRHAVADDATALAHFLHAFGFRRDPNARLVRGDVAHAGRRWRDRRQRLQLRRRLRERKRRGDDER